MKKTLFLLAALALATAGPSFAQTAVKTTGTDANQTARHYEKKGPKDPAKTASHKADKMAKELGLNADQKSKVEKLMLARQQESTTLKTKYAADKNAGRTEMKAAHDRYETQLKAILTPEQFAKMDKMKAEHHGHGKDGGKMKMKGKA